jgi:hypothetical protein
LSRVTYLHLGLAKTGTSTIQSALFHEREKLSAVGVLYPGFSKNHSTPLRSVFGTGGEMHRLAGNRLFRDASPEAAAAVADGWSRQLDEALAAPGWTKLVLSAEGLSTLPALHMTVLRDRLRTGCCP